uniref:Cytochrome P450 n=1 Tax=viral metagenome TaxID=1070528 RepID=A0A6C0C9P0_9ZZZZ
MLTHLILGFFLIFTYHYWSLYKRKHNKPKHLSHLKDVPIVAGELPFIGHSLKFDPTNFNFINECYQKYGKIFRIKMFRTDMIVIADRSLIDEFYKADESKLSFIEAIIRSFIGGGVAQKDEFVVTILNLLKTNLKIDYDNYLPKIKSECISMVQFIKNSNKPIDVNEFVKKIIITSSSKCFLSLDLDEKLYNMISNYVNLLTKVLILSAMIPKIVLDLMAKPIFQYYRTNITKFFKPTIDRYRNDPEFNDSMILRKSVDHIDPETNMPLIDDQISGIIIAGMFASFSSTGLGLSAMIGDLMANPEYWYRIRDETKMYVENDDLHGMLKSVKLLDATFWETCRASSSFLPVLRYASTPNESLGEYYVGQNILIGLCAPLLSANDESARNIFKDPERYDPERFLEPRNEKTSSGHIVTFGGGRHMCPGRNFAKMEMEMAVVYLVNNFDPFKIVKMSKPEIMTAGGFVERKTFLVTAN